MNFTVWVQPDSGQCRKPEIDEIIQYAESQGLVVVSKKDHERLTYIEDLSKKFVEDFRSSQDKKFSFGRFWSYLKYVVRHKWYVLKSASRTDCSLWRALIHDLSKLRPSEWSPYSRTFYEPDGSKKKYSESTEFLQAWNQHQKLNPHHWQHWVLTMDGGSTAALEMPETYVREMVADWMGAGLAITGKNEVEDWYTKNKNKMILHPNTRDLVESLIQETKRR
jgi:hypothetical protein